MSKVPLPILWFAALSSAVGAPSLATEAFGILDKNCSACHGPRAPASAFMLLDQPALIAGGKVVPGNSAASPLYQRIVGQGGPLMPKGGPRLSETDIATVRRWIDASAPAWETRRAPARRFISNDEVKARIAADIRSLDPRDRGFTRYFTLTNIFNTGTDEARLDLYRKALSKLLNCLSWERTITLPVPIDNERTILRIDLRSYDFSQAKWRTIIDGYAYDLAPTTDEYRATQQLTETDVPAIRADWFVAAASLPPLYHRILDLPSTQEELLNCGEGVQRCLHINIKRILRDAPGILVWRVGFSDSGVSNNSRIVDRYESPFGAFYVSADFADNLGAHNFHQQPLVFERSGGEAIFTLPNGLLAFLLVNAEGRRLNTAPVNIVFNKRGPRAEIRTGLSCMVCHARGLLPLADDMAPSLASLPADQRDYAQHLYVGATRMTEKRLEDQKHYDAALAQLGVHPNEDEPIGALAERYNQSLDAAAAASEFGISKNQLLKQLSNPGLRGLGLAALSVGGTIKRDAFEEEVFGRAAEALGIGSYCAPTRVYGERFFSKPLSSVATEDTGGCLERRQK